MHPARVRLNLYGATVTEVAVAAGLSQSAVTRQLAGESRVSDPVRDALVARVGPEAAADVLDAIPATDQRQAA